jgi:hypothetical protein
MGRLDGVASISRTSSALDGVRPASRRPQPVPLVVIAQQHLCHRQADQLGVGHLRPLAWTGPGKPSEGMIWSVSST